MSGSPPQNDPMAHKRTFRSPSGRDWTVEVYHLPQGIAAQGARGAEIARKSILRFVSSDVTLDLCTFPENWESLADDELVTLLRSASPPTFIRS